MVCLCIYMCVVSGEEEEGVGFHKAQLIVRVRGGEVEEGWGCSLIPHADL